MPAINNASLQPEGILDDYRGAYQDVRKGGVDPRLGLIMELGAYTDGLTNTRGYLESLGHPRYQPKGDPVHSEGADSKNFQITNYHYSIRYEWYETDERADRVKGIPQAAAGAARNHALLPVRGAFDILTDTASLIPAIPNAADGSSLFSTSTRFEAANGNSLVVTSWSASGPAARAAIFTGLEQFGAYKDGKGQPLWENAGVLDNPVLVIHAMADMDIMAEVFHQGTVAYANSTSNAGVDNVLLTQGRKFVPWPTQRLSTGTMILGLTGLPVKPLVMQEWTAVIESWGDRTNSDECRTYNKKYAQVEQDLGFGVGLPYGLIKIAAA